MAKVSPSQDKTEIPENLLACDGEAYLWPEFFSKLDSDAYFQELLLATSWQQEPIKIFGKEIMQPRLTAWYGDSDKPYRYSGITMQPKAWTPALLEIKHTIEQICQVDFTSALLNLYRDQHDSIGWHRDNEESLGPNPVVGSVSFGATRKFQMRHCADSKLRIATELTHGSFLLMRGKTQYCWAHRVPKETRDIGTRINMTFRAVAGL